MKIAHGKLAPAVADAASQKQKFSAVQPLDYFLAEAVLEQLKPTGQKNVMGWFTGEAGTWEKIVAAYRRQGGCGAFFLCIAFRRAPFELFPDHVCR